MRSSGQTAKATTDDTAITVMDRAASGYDVVVNVLNYGTAAGLVSIDGGATWLNMPPSPDGISPSSRTIDVTRSPANAKVMAKRFPGGANMTGLWADAA
jgi:hypothetical protein